MKKILTTLAISGLTVAAFAQGVVNWTGAAGYVIVETNSTAFSSFTPHGGATPTGGAVGNVAANTSSLYYFELLVSSTASSVPTTAANLGSWLDTGLAAGNGASANGRILQLNGTTASVANNLPAGATLNDVLVGWSANLGSTWSMASSNLVNWASAPMPGAFFGVSALGNIQGIASPGPGNQAFGTGAGQILNQSPNQMQLDSLYNVPEPGTLALAAIAGASLLLFRRKK